MKIPTDVTSSEDKAISVPNRLSDGWREEGQQEVEGPVHESS